MRQTIRLHQRSTLFGEKTPSPPVATKASRALTSITPCRTMFFSGTAAMTLISTILRLKLPEPLLIAKIFGQRHFMNSLRRNHTVLHPMLFFTIISLIFIHYPLKKRLNPFPKTVLSKPNHIITLYHSKKTSHHEKDIAIIGCLCPIIVACAI